MYIATPTSSVQAMKISSSHLRTIICLPQIPIYILVQISESKFAQPAGAMPYLLWIYLQCWLSYFKSKTGWRCRRETSLQEIGRKLTRNGSPPIPVSQSHTQQAISANDDKLVCQNSSSCKCYNFDPKIAERIFTYLGAIGKYTAFPRRKPHLIGFLCLKLD